MTPLLRIALLLTALLGIASPVVSVPPARRPASNSPNRFLGVKAWRGTVSYSLNYSVNTSVPGGSISRSETQNIHAGFTLSTQKKDGPSCSWSGSYTLTGNLQKLEGVKNEGADVEATTAGTGHLNITNYQTLDIDTVGKTYAVGLPSLDVNVTVSERTIAQGMTETKSDRTTRTITAPGTEQQPLPTTGMVLAGTRKIKIDITLDPREPRFAEGTLTWNLRPVGMEVPKVSIELLSKTKRPTVGETFTVRGSWKDCKPEAFRFLLTDVSSEPGYCVNDPSRTTKPDLEFVHALNGDKRYGARETSPGTWVALPGFAPTGNQMTVSIRTLDYGGWGVVRFEAKVNGNWITATAPPSEGTGGEFVRIPYDTDRNHIADVWENRHGVMGRGATYDGDLNGTTGGQASMRDAMTIYQEYRGFFVVGTNGKTVWQDMDPNRKEVFYIDDQKLIDPALFEEFTKIRAYRVKKPYVGEGSDFKASRLVDLNRGYASGVRKYAINIHPLPGQDDPNITNAPASALKWQLGYTADGGSIKTADFCFVFPDRITSLLGFRLEQIKRTINPDPNDTGTPNAMALLQLRNNEGITQAQAERLAREWTPALTQKLSKEYLKFIALHEMIHACGAFHHGKRDGGEEFFPPLGCIMRYLRIAEDWKNMLGMLQNPNFTLKGTVYSNVCRNGVNCWSLLRADDN